MQTRVIGEQAAFDGSVTQIKRPVWTRPLSWWRPVAERDQQRCDWCFEHYFEHAKTHNSDLYDFAYYEGPWAKEYSVDHLCPACAYTHSREGTPEGFFYCDSCSRDMPDSHGHRVNYRFVYNSGIICVACFQEMCLANNDIIKAFVDPDRDEEVTPFDFYNHKELEAAGFEEYESIHIYGREGVEHLRKRCAQLLEEGLHIVIDQGSTSIMGDELSVTIYTKPLEEEETNA